MRNALSIIFLLASVAACSAAFVHGADKQQKINDRTELTRCQQGYTLACKRWQQIASNYQPHNSMEDSRGN